MISFILTLVDECDEVCDVHLRQRIRGELASVEGSRLHQVWEALAVVKMNVGAPKFLTSTLPAGTR